MPELFPPIEPFHTEMISVSDLHTLHVEQVGNPKGKPVLFLHGGPGGGVRPHNRQYFDPKFYRIILFDQRGCGRSTPHAELRENTTWDLVSDIEKIRKHLDIQDWLVFGGSWGSTLALAYAIEHPKSVRGLILRGIFLCRPLEIEWFYQEGASMMFPELWEKYLEPVPPSQQNKMVESYYKLLTSPDTEVRLHAAKRWSQWEAGTSTLFYDQSAVDNFEEPDLALAFARIECHYFVNHAFFKTPNFLLENVDKIKDIPCWIVQGRYDLVCPPASAWSLYKLLPKATLYMIADAGHSVKETGIYSKLIEIMEEAKKYA